MKSPSNPGEPVISSEAAEVTHLRSQRDRAYEDLRRILLLQQISEGERLREPEWSERLGVNRVALREAFARLEAEGLLDKGPKTGYFVPVLSREDVHEILEVRAALECAAVERICAGGPPSKAVTRVLESLCSELEMLIDRGYLQSAGEADRRFHEELVALAKNKRLSRIFGNAPLPMLHGRITSSTAWETECRHTLREHRSIVAAVSAGDIEGAQRLLKEHLHGAYLDEVFARS